MNSFPPTITPNSFFVDVAIFSISLENFSLFVFIPIPTTIYFSFSPLVLLCVSIPPIFFPLYTISFGSFIFNSIL